MEIREIVHEAGGLLYYDGANLNAYDKVRPGDMGFDAVHKPTQNVYRTLMAVADLVLDQLGLLKN